MRRYKAMAVLCTGNLLRDRSGNILILFCFMSFGLALMTGAAVDFGRAVALRAGLQNAVDAAALAGTADFTDLAQSGHQQAIATDYMNASLPLMMANAGVDFTVTPYPTKVDGVITAFNVRVTAVGRVNTAFLSLLVDAIPVSVASTATIPAIIFTSDSGGDGSMPSLLPASDSPGLYERPRNLDLEAFGIGLGQEHLIQ
jgi:Flp pilus assembly protein TadG